LFHSLNETTLTERAVSYAQKGDRALIKQMNQQLVLRLIQGRGPISRKDIAQTTGLSPAAISGITGALLDMGLVHEVGEAEADGRAGRRAVMLRLNPRAGNVVGVKLSVRTISCVVTDLDANVLHYIESILTPPAPFDPEATIAATIQAIHDVLDIVKIEPARLLGIGLGVNGTVDAEAGVSRLAPHFGWRDVSLAAPIEAHFGIPVQLENDARTLTIAEQWFGAGREVDDFVTVVVGYGIGAGLVTNRQLYRGATGGAGEFGHSVLQPDGPVCSCGKRGCLEAFAALPAIFREAGAALAAGRASALAEAKPLTVEAVAHAAEAGDPLALEVLATAGRWLGIGLANLVNVFNPALIVMNGEAVALGHPYLGPMESVLRERAFDGLTDSPRIVLEPGGNEVWARGAACIVLGALFTSLEPERGAQLARTVQIAQSA
jgi:N-acetylglucosamine repressor